MRILGIDPGTAICGFSILDYDGNYFKLIDFGVITMPTKMDLEKRLLHIYDKTNKLITKYKPEHMAIEDLFFNNNTKTALSVGHARGVCLLLSAQKNLLLVSYTPLQVKQSVVGYGRAGKRQVQEMVKIILKMDKIPKPDDAADAIAVAICHGHSYKINSIYK